MKKWYWMFVYTLSSSSFASETHNSTIADGGINVIKHVRLWIAVLWNLRAVLGLGLVVFGFIGWYKANKADNDVSVLWPISFSIAGALLTFHGGLDLVGEVFTFSDTVDPITLDSSGRANLSSNTTYIFDEGDSTE
ncbi:hypothetical protein P3719_21650 [Vibrio parahaemolyticus]|uniref:Uncharacterized protein n=4 Tax=Vibrio harveyi group TaxID=717610 RepID=A0AA47JN00_VIBPH|nr:MULTISPECIES: hypothetical protein [Vibrio]EJG1066074.1 hypothetical protein [Vibrio parahaemolyticus O1]MDW1807397.1 hypothetical protein [Vibrio sp. Vb2362]MDW2296444.1 hypothetical protein [Vibrio sp. 1404]OOH98593.1 hypothetical protein BIW16_18920 [Vibrio sp. OULL4]APX09760.1 hypothetical protein BWP24_26475 [Vibrio campbellii]